MEKYILRWRVEKDFNHEPSLKVTAATREPESSMAESLGSNPGDLLAQLAQHYKKESAMHREFKKLLWGYGLMIGGLIIAMTFMVLFALTRNPDMFARVLCGVAIVLIGIVISFYYLDQKKVNLVRRWCKLKLGKSIEFPNAPLERDALLPWAEATLNGCAKAASNAFAIRNVISEKVDAFKPPNSCIPHDLLSFRVERAQISGEYREKEFAAERVNEAYLAHWDFFKDMGMLPKNPKTGQPWDDPKTFREDVEGKEVVVTPPPNETAESVELKSDGTAPRREGMNFCYGGGMMDEIT